MTVNWPKLHQTPPNAGYARAFNATPTAVPFYEQALRELLTRPEFIRFLEQLGQTVPEFAQAIAHNTYCLKFIEDTDGTVRINVKPSPDAIGKNIPLAPDFNHLHALARFMLGHGEYPVDASAPPPVASPRPRVVTHRPSPSKQRARRRREKSAVPPDLLRMMRAQQKQTRDQARLIHQLTEHIASESERQREQHATQLQAQREAHGAELGRLRDLTGEMNTRHDAALQAMQEQHRQQIALLETHRTDDLGRFDGLIAKMDGDHREALDRQDQHHQAATAQQRQDHAQERQRMDAAHASAMTQLRDHHTHEMGLLQRQIDQMGEQHNTEIARLEGLLAQGEERSERAETAHADQLRIARESHAEQVQQLRDDHREQIRLMRVDRADEIQRHNEELLQMRTDHADQLTQMRADRDTFVQQVRDDAAANLELFRAQFADHLEDLRNLIAQVQPPNLQGGPHVEPSEDGDDRPDDAPIDDGASVASEHSDDGDGAGLLHAHAAPDHPHHGHAAAPPADGDQPDPDSPKPDPLRQQLQDATDENRELYAANAQLRLNADRLSLDLQILAARVPALETQIVQLEALRTELEEARRYLTRLAPMEGELDRLRRTLAQRESELREQLDGVQGRLSRLTPMEAELGQVRHDLGQRNSELRRLGDLIRQLESEASDSQRTILSLRSQLQRAQGPDLGAQEQIQSLQARLTQATQQRDQFQQLATRLQTRLEQEQARSQRLDTENIALRDESIEIQSRRAEDVEAITQLEHDLQQAQLALQQQRHQYEAHLRHVQGQYEERLQALQRENHHLFAQHATDVTALEDMQRAHEQLRTQWAQELAEANHARDLAEAESSEFGNELEVARATELRLRQRLSRQAVDHLIERQRLEERIQQLTMALFFAQFQLQQRARLPLPQHRVAPSPRRIAPPDDRRQIPSIPRPLEYRLPIPVRYPALLQERPPLSSAALVPSNQPQLPAPEEEIVFDPSNPILTGIDPIHDSQLLLEEFNHARAQEQSRLSMVAQLEDGTIVHPMRPIPQAIHPMNFSSYLFPWLQRPSARSPVRPFYGVAAPWSLSQFRPQMQPPAPPPAQPEPDVSDLVVTGMDPIEDLVLFHQAIRRSEQQRNNPVSPMPFTRFQMPGVGRNYPFSSFGQRFSPVWAPRTSPSPSASSAASRPMPPIANVAPVSDRSSHLDLSSVIYTGDEMAFQTDLYLEMNRQRTQRGDGTNCAVQ